MNFSVLIGGACTICNYFLGAPKLESITMDNVGSCIITVITNFFVGGGGGGGGGDG